MEKLYGKLFFIIVLLFSITCFHYREDIQHISTHTKTKNDSKKYIVTIQMKNKTEKMELEKYLVGVLAGEMPVSFELEALKAQAIASRTFVLSRHLKVDNTTQSQVYLTNQQMKKRWGKNYSKNKKKIEKAINETKGKVMTYQGEYVSALFFSSSNGNTVNSEDYFTGHLDYLKKVDSHWDKTVDPNFKRIKVFSKNTIAQAFHVTSPTIKVLSYTKSGYVDKVKVNSKTYTGREIRERLNLASSCFHISKTKKGYQFITHGSGHGVGMSQYGALAMAKENKTCDEILHHYYKNIKIESI